MRNSQRIVMASRPVGRPESKDFRFETVDIGEPGPNQVLLKTLYLSLDPYMRQRMRDEPSYSPPLPIGDMMPGATVSRVIVSNHPDWQVGDIALGWSGWQTYEVTGVEQLRKVNPAWGPISTALGVLGMPGFTAYCGLKEIGKPKAGETVVVAAASGAVGSIVGQIAQLSGARAVGIAGGAEKCAFVKDELGFDAVVDHRAPDFAVQLAKACPDGIDVYFELVGGPVWDAVLPLLNDFGRVVVCGLVAHYNEKHEGGNWGNVGINMRDFLVRSMTVRGFIQTEFKDRLEPEYLEQAAKWVAAGQLKYREHIVEGFENTTQAFAEMLEGRNFGKVAIKVAD